VVHKGRSKGERFRRLWTGPCCTFGPNSVFVPNLTIRLYGSDQPYYDPFLSVVAICGGQKRLSRVNNTMLYTTDIMISQTFWGALADLERHERKVREHLFREHFHLGGVCHTVGKLRDSTATTWLYSKLILIDVRSHERWIRREPHSTHISIVSSALNGEWAPTGARESPIRRRHRVQPLASFTLVAVWNRPCTVIFVYTMNTTPLKGCSACLWLKLIVTAPILAPSLGQSVFVLGC
jgi:hypothetical protein